MQKHIRNLSAGSNHQARNTLNASLKETQIWSIFGPLGSHFGAILAHVWASWTPLWRHCGAHLEFFLGLPFRTPFWTLSGPLWGPSWAPLGAHLGPSWAQDGAKLASKWLQKSIKKMIDFWINVISILEANLGPSWADFGTILGPLRGCFFLTYF